MAVEDKDSRTEPATPKRLEDARSKGQIAKSQDLNVAFLMLAIFVSLFFAGERSVSGIKQIMAKYLNRLSTFSFDGVALVRTAAEILGEILNVVLPLVGLAFLVMVLSNLIQVGFLVTAEPMKPDMGKLNPLKGFGRILSLRGLAKVLFGILKVLVIGWILVWTLLGELAELKGENVIALLRVEESAALHYALRVIVLMGLRGVAALLVLAILDFTYQKWQHARDMRMTKQEVKEEMQQLEGDPKLKGRRRKVQQEIIVQNMMREVPRADVVIANPTHFSVAIRYDRKQMSAPRCVAKGQDLLARRIREIALQSSVPVVEKPALARSLHAAVEVGQEIPQEFYRAVAEVLAYVYQMSRRDAVAS